MLNMLQGRADDSLPIYCEANYAASDSRRSSTSSASLDIIQIPTSPFRWYRRPRRNFTTLVFIAFAFFLILLFRRRLQISLSLIFSYTFDIQAHDVLGEWKVGTETVTFDALYPKPTPMLESEENAVFAAYNNSMTKVSYDALLTSSQLPDYIKMWHTTKPRELVPPLMHNVLLTRSYAELFNASIATAKPFILKDNWRVAHHECQRLHPRWHFVLWTDDDAEEFMSRYHPELFEQWMRYPQTIQRSNLLRYLILGEFGGVYTDLDLRCRVNLDPLRNLPFVTPGAPPAGVNNAFIASRPGHPFWRYIADQSKYYNLYYPLPYLENMASTGCLFFTTQHLAFRSPSLTAIASFSGRILGSRWLITAGTVSPLDKLYVLPKGNNLSGHIWTPLFEHFGASSWHSWDATLIGQLPGMIGMLAKFSVPSLLTLTTIFLARRYWRRRQQHLIDALANRKPLMLKV